MIASLVDGAVATQEVPGSVRALSSLPDPDYVDLFTLPTDTEATPEQWARAMFGDVPSLAELLIWRGLLGLRLARGDRRPPWPDDRSADVARIGSDLRLLPGS